MEARVFGENLVVFRDRDGRVGVLDEAYPYKRASLVRVRNEEGGLRCLFHSWKKDVQGNVLAVAGPTKSVMRTDDTATAFYFIASGDAAETPETEAWRKFARQTAGIDLDRHYRPLRSIDNCWQARQTMKAGNFTGIPDFPNLQDVAM